MCVRLKKTFDLNEKMSNKNMSCSIIRKMCTPGDGIDTPNPRDLHTVKVKCLNIPITTVLNE